MARDLKSVALLSKDPAVNDFLTEFQQESDRAAAVLGPAMLDVLLKDLLTERLVSKRLGDKLLGRMMPIGTFSARITLAEAVGLISAQEAKDLHTMRDIRNDFAHELHGITFETQSVRDRCNNLVGAKRTLELSSNKRFSEIYPRTTRATFNLAVSVAMVHINTRLESVQKIKAAEYLIADAV